MIQELTKFQKLRTAVFCANQMIDFFKALNPQTLDAGFEKRMRRLLVSEMMNKET